MAAIPCAVGSIAIKHSEASATWEPQERYFAPCAKIASPIASTTCGITSGKIVSRHWKISRIKSILKDDDDFNPTKPCLDERDRLEVNLDHELLDLPPTLQLS